MPPRSACLLLDTKHPREDTKLLGSVGHTPGENPKIHIFAIRITNERIKLTSLLIQYQSIIFIIITVACKHVIRIIAEIIIYSWHDEVLIYKLRQHIIKLSFIKIFSESYK